MMMSCKSFGELLTNDIYLMISNQWDIYKIIFFRIWFCKKKKKENQFATEFFL